MGCILINAKQLIRGSLLMLICCSLGCSIAGPAADELNPYGEGNAVQTLGKRDQSALQNSGGGGSKAALNARHALEVMGSYRRAQAPQPAYPVVRPAEVRLMWVPDHLNRHGDLVAAHYYYLRIMNDRWAVQDAFEIESQINNNTGIDYAPAGGGGALGGPAGSYGTSGGGAGGATPWVYKEE
jgi:hypothetical protein